MRQVDAAIDRILGAPGRIGATVDRIGKEIDKWWNGVPETDPEGYPVVVGGVGTWNTIAPRGFAITPNGKVHIKPEDRDLYMGDSDSSRKWRYHEHAHIDQRENMGTGVPDGLKTIWFVMGIVAEYITEGGHSGAGLEQDADRVAQNKLHWRSLAQ